MYVFGPSQEFDLWDCTKISNHFGGHIWRGNTPTFTVVNYSALIVNEELITLSEGTIKFMFHEKRYFWKEK